MRDSTGRLFGERRSKAMKKNVAYVPTIHPQILRVLNSALLPTRYSSIVRSMIARHPFNRWPLHVKLFTEEAVAHWAASARAPHVPPLPPGFTCAVELEGVDGKSGHPGSGRTGPIAADDGARIPYLCIAPATLTRPVAQPSLRRRSWLRIPRSSRLGAAWTARCATPRWTCTRA